MSNRISASHRRRRAKAAAAAQIEPWPIQNARRYTPWNRIAEFTWFLRAGARHPGRRGALARVFAVVLLLSIAASLILPIILFATSR